VSLERYGEKMDTIFIEKPFFLIFPIALLLLQIAIFVLNKKNKGTAFISTLLVSVCLVGHAVAVTVILLFGGTLSDALLLVLFSGALSLLLSPKPNKNDREQEGNN